MSKKYKKGKQPPKETTIENFYDLKTKEMDELVAALKGETPEDAPVPTANIAEITGETQEGNKKKSGKAEFDPYKRDKFSRIFPFWLKALFIKFWFFGLVRCLWEMTAPLRGSRAWICMFCADLYAA